MKLTVLGGSAASPNVGMGCAGVLLQTDRTRLVLDLGPGTLQELRRHTDFRTLDAVIVSHMHVDHVLDLLCGLAFRALVDRKVTDNLVGVGGDEEERIGQ